MKNPFKYLKNIWFPSGYIKPNAIDVREENAKRISSYIAPVQFARLKADTQSWRDAINEAELAFFPHRVKQQRIYMDTVINAHVFACMQRRINLTVLKDFGLYNGETEDTSTTELFRSKWFYELMRYALEAKFYGYSLIELGDLENNSFPKLNIVKRENISPDRLNVTAFIYSISGINFMQDAEKDESGESYKDWTIYVDTPSDKGVSKCGYGLLYKVAYYEILLRNLTGFNATYVELYGQPIRHIKTTKFEGEEYDRLIQSAEEMGSNAYFISDPTDELELKDGSKAGTGYKSYDNFEARLEKKISKIILGHADALDSTTGKLGGDQGGEESPVAQSLEDIETVDSREFEHLMNDVVLPKLINIGFPVSPGLKFKFKNDKERQEIRDKQDASNSVTATYVKTLADAGFKVSAEWLAEHTGIPLEEKEEPVIQPFNKEIRNKLSKMYP